MVSCPNTKAEIWPCWTQAWGLCLRYASCPSLDLFYAQAVPHFAMRNEQEFQVAPKNPSATVI